MVELKLFLLLFSGLFGLLVGSFLNVLIYRLPNQINFVLPRSHCTRCGAQIRWYENIPVLSYVFLKGKCSSCNAKIPTSYVLIEIFSGIVGLLLAPDNLEAYNIFNSIFYFSIYCCFIVHFIVDLSHQILPDEINIFLGVLFLVVSVINFPLNHSILGFLIGFGFPLLVSWIFYKLRGQIGLGGGDIKLFGVLGIYLGPVGIVQNIFLSCTLGSLVGVALIGLKLIDKNKPIPFGPFIIMVATFQIFGASEFNHLMRYIA